MTHDDRNTRASARERCTQCQLVDAVALRNERRCRTFIVRCNISWVPWISCTLPFSADHEHSRPQSTTAQFPCHERQEAREGAPPYALAVTVTVGVLAISALVNRHLAKTAEIHNPPTGRFLEVNGVRIHYFELGRARRWSCCTAMAA